jgi:hypothetical protein
MITIFSSSPEGENLPATFHKLIERALHKSELLYQGSDERVAMPDIPYPIR